ncbi:M56 family metallopeptidase [Ekhidna sp.]|uniref:M56 family metallopeptidase n=1 Tax=Ekhidna sp. TaxID=2608089 RepID=UPI003CCC404F
MNKVIVFLLESSVFLGVLYLIYYLLLRKEASFNFNRFYLLGALACAFTLPLLSVDFLSQERGVIDQPMQQLSDIRLTYQGAVSEWSAVLFDQDFTTSSVGAEKKENHDGMIIKVLLIIYSTGLVVMIFRLIWMVRWISNLKAGNPEEVVDGINIVKVPYQMAPFSFINSVFVPKEMIDSKEFFQILEHEKTHIRQRHSFDLIIVQLLSAILWFNPVIWWLGKSLKTTHEYIADRKMIKQGYSLVEYQTLLLRQLISNNSFGLVHNFNLSFIKKRITMMNIQKLGGLGKFKVATVIAITTFFSLIVIQCNSKLDEQGATLKEEISVNLPVLDSYYIFFEVNSSNHIGVTIKDNEIFVNGARVSLADIDNFARDYNSKTEVVLKIDQSQKMKLVNEVQEAFRRNDLRLMVYQCENSSGRVLNAPIQLPPGPNSKSKIMVPELTDEFIAEHGLDLLEIDLGGSSDAITDQVEALVRKHIGKMESKYVVRGIFRDSDTFKNYLSNFQLMKLGFYKIYEERAEEMFGKSFFEINGEQKTSEEAKEQYREVREGVPMAILLEKV